MFGSNKRPEPVELPPTQWQIYQTNDNEPQPVTIKEPSSAWVYISSKDSPPGQRANNFLVAASGIQLFKQASRVVPIGTGIFNWYIPNVNPTNNVIEFFSSVTSLTYTVSVPVGFYSDTTVLATAIVTAMNTVTGSSGLTFSQTAIALFPGAYTLSAVGGNWYFVAGCLALTQGDTVFQFPTDQVATASKKIGPMPLKYTLWVDITSQTLTKYAKMRSVTTASKSQIFLRAFMGGLDWGNTTYTSDLLELLQFAFRPQEVVTSIDIQLYDSHGNLLYIPDDLDLVFQLTIEAEM